MEEKTQKATEFLSVNLHHYMCQERARSNSYGADPTFRVVPMAPIFMRFNLLRRSATEERLRSI